MTVHLVGAGPGDPELLTVRALRLLERADVVLYDRLVDSAILQLAPSWATLVPVGKNPDGPSVSQVEINAMLIDFGHRAETVVRLKGGDPYLFGRGSEEAAALVDAGIDVQVVPGISASLAGPAAGGVPVTARGVASGVTIVTGHQCERADNPLDWHALAKTGTTLVVLMGARHASSIATKLLDTGMLRSTPVAVVTKATRPDQEVLRLSLGELRATERLDNPSVITIGAVAALPDLPLFVRSERLAATVPLTL